MAEGLISYLGRDLGEALAAGYRRTPAVCASGGMWLLHWGSLSALAGLLLFFFCGYQAGFLRFNALAGQFPDWIWQWLTVLGDERVAFALGLFLTRRYPRVFWSLIAAALVGIALTHSFKPFVSALRPPAVLDPDSFNLIGPGHRKASFPSGHTVTAAVFFGVWVYFMRSRLVRGLLVLLAIAVGLSRVAVGVHWPLDVAAGLALGVTAAWLGVLLARRSEEVGMDPSIHLAFVTLASFLAASLLLWDGGYEAAAEMQHFVGAGALAYAACVYLIFPLLRWLRLRRGRFGLHGEA